MTHAIRLTTLLTGIALVLAGTAPAAAQPTMEAPMMGRGRPPFLDKLFLPRLIMRNQAQIGLTAEQRTAITNAMGDTQRKMVELQWQSEAESQRLADMLDKHPIAKETALAQAKKIMDVEAQLKQTHLAMLISIRNELTPEQQAKLQQLRPPMRRRASRRPMRRPMPMGQDEAPAPPPPPPEE